MRTTKQIIAVSWLLLICLATCQAHNLNMAGVKVRLEKSGVDVSVVAHLHQLSAADPGNDLSHRLKLRLDRQPFTPEKTQIIRDKANGIVIWQAKQKRTASWVALDAPLFPERAEQTTVLTVLKDRQVLDEAAVDVRHPSAVIGRSGEASGAPTIFLRFLRQGIFHIFTGPDHILFLISLLLLGGSWKRLLKIVSAFTLAHSLTLSLAATGIFSLPPRLVEPVIALSIVAVALANIRNARKFSSESEDVTAKGDLRPWLAFGFGLIHGFGFAGALTEVGLPREALGIALVAFNAGVEVSQATIVLLFAPTLAALVRMWPKIQHPLVRYGSVSVAAVGAFWFVQRLFTV